jgi:hypothetical protein
MGGEIKIIGWGRDKIKHVIGKRDEREKKGR